MTKRTYTLLVTIDDDKPLVAMTLADLVQRALEEGRGRGYVSVSSASVDAVDGDVMEPMAFHRSPYNKDIHFNTSKIKHLHAELAKP